MDIYDEDLLLFWKSLFENNVKYLMVGDYAATLNGYHGFTNVMEIWIKDDSKNIQQLTKAMNVFGYNNLSLEHMQFLSGWANLRIGNGIVVDVFTIMKGLEIYTFDECLGLAPMAEIENVKVPFLQINQLILNKKAVNRLKDQLDVMELEKIIQLRKEMGLD